MSTIKAGPYVYSGYNDSNCDNTYDFIIKRGDTLPNLEIILTDAESEMLSALPEPIFVKASMWFKGKLSESISLADTTMSLMNNIGFDKLATLSVAQFQDGGWDIDKEIVQISHIDQNTHVITIIRGYAGTIPVDHDLGASICFYRFMNSPGIYDKDNGVVTYNWAVGDTKIPGEYYLELEVRDSSGNGLSFPNNKPGYLILVQGECQS